MGMMISRAALSTFYHDAKDIFGRVAQKQTYRLVGRFRLSRVLLSPYPGMPFVYPEMTSAIRQLSQHAFAPRTQVSANPTLERASSSLHPSCDTTELLRHTIRASQSHVDPYSPPPLAIVPLGPLHGGAMRRARRAVTTSCSDRRVQRRRVSVYGTNTTREFEPAPWKARRGALRDRGLRW